MHKLTKVAKYLRNYFRMSAEILVAAFDVYRQPINTFTRNGYEVIPAFLGSQDCSRIVDFAKEYLRGESYIIPEQNYRNSDGDGGKCYVNYRSEIRDVNLGVVQFINVQKLDPRFSQLLSKVQRMLEERTGERLVAQSAVIQLDMPDSTTKRRLHTDGLTLRYKAFVYLNDVNGLEDGPYNVVPYSHRHAVRKLVNLLYVRWKTLRWSHEKYTRSDKFGDMVLFYSEQQSKPILGQAGTLTLSNQLIAHQGGYNQNPRWALILNFIPSKHWDGRPFDMWQREVEAEVGNRDRVPDKAQLPLS
ncbi:MAG: hypothetical protein KME03_10630 [Aphanocapsa lilacina HA4352-LM1]|jgi:hypothetical protein|nr:hypothetical protein [Aphanocapsa lilacina HA4352-LM1]